MSLSEPGRARAVAALAIVATALLAAGALDAALAQGAGPFGVQRPAAPPPAQADGIVGWILAKQAEFYKQFSGLIRAAKADGSAVWGLLGVAFLYGVFHAAGPGHGKAVISSYVVANDETWKRGVVLSFVSAMLQALVAVAIVGIAAVLLNATAATMRRATDWIETVAYALIVLIGLRLLWVKGWAFLKVAGQLLWPAPAVAQAHAHAHAHHGHSHAHHEHSHHDHGHHDHTHHRHDHGHHDHKHHSHDHAHGHHHHDHSHDDHASAWGHAHAPEPEELAGPGGWKRGLTAIVAVGLRPCSGAIIVLVFALAQGLFWAGVAATFVMGLGTAITVAAIATLAVGAKAWAGKLASSNSGYGTLAMRGIEVGAAMLITAFGALLLVGYMASERLGGF
ncbi:MAG: nickel/cobalt transporter [Alphaproteobacteria bacterium]|nr:nickel/cobalt transporter [Alphaproteobacteria bacterium]